MAELHAYVLYTCINIYVYMSIACMQKLIVGLCRPAYASRKQTNDEVDRDVELPYYELERLYSGTPAGRAMLNDLRQHQAGVAHPDPKAHGILACVRRKNYTCMHVASTKTTPTTDCTRSSGSGPLTVGASIMPGMHASKFNVVLLQECEGMRMFFFFRSKDEGGQEQG